MDEADIYQHGLETHGASPLALHWTDYRTMAIRFKYLVADLAIDSRTILDAGSGMGDLLPYLYAKADSFNYLGVDANPGFVEIAKKRYSGHRFEVGDPFSGNYTGQFDLVISSGVMNINVKNWRSRRKTMIKNLFDLAGEALAFNMAGSIRPAVNDSLIAYADAGDILNFCKKLSNRVVLRADYLPQDFTIVMYKH
ncbi:MAG TPA: class I SAM-dependent methyltransferase [Candidatus Saccharimonadales bacterium]|nr:class I SAM-dependent methyltransferase [Candidatus Saccharimonadales bacterium]